MRTIALSAVLIAATAALPAFADQKAQENSVKNLALMMIAEARCPTLRPNYTAMGVGMKALGVAPKDWGEGGRYHALLLAEIEKRKTDVLAMSQDGFCTYIEDGFGPDGVIASGMVKKR